MVRLRRFVLCAALTAPAFAQSLTGPEDAAFFTQAASSPALPCQIEQIRPALDFAFRFRAGYSVSMPLVQFRGAGHEATVHTRVTPEGRPPLYFSKTERFPEVPETKAEAVSTGGFIVGEGAYRVDVVVQDEQMRICRANWQIQARYSGSERQLTPPTPALAVQEIDAEPPAEDPRTGLRIARLTILVHAAPLLPNLSKLQPEDVRRLTDSVSAILGQLPANSVRLAAFNLDMRATVYRSDDFNRSQLGELESALEKMQLGAIDYRVLQNMPNPIDLLVGLMQAEWKAAEPPTALLIVGPPARDTDAPPQMLDKPAAGFPIFSLQFQAPRRMPVFDGTGDQAQRRRRIGAPEEGPPAQPISVAIADGIERLMERLKAENITIRTPRDLSDFIRRIDPRLARVPATTPSRPPATQTPATGEPAAAAAPAAASGPKEPSSDADPVEVLMRVRDRVLEQGVRVPNHTCVETVERARYERPGGEPPKSCDAILARRKRPGFETALRLSTTDRLRLDVAFSGEREIYSWAGASRFEEGEIDELIPEGAMGTGPFATFLMSVFGERTPRFVFEGEITPLNRALFEYSFRVPREESHYRHKVAKGQWVIVGYSGSLQVDPKTAELVRLAIRTEELPSETHGCEVDTTLDYGSVRLEGGDFLLPSATRQRFIGMDGAEAENVYAFSACRDFRAQSSIAFGGETKEKSSQPAAASAAVAWPSGLRVSIESATPMDSETSAAGDRIEGRLLGALRDAGGKVLAPAHARVSGRLLRVEVRHPSPPQVTFALRWETIEIDGVNQPLNLRPDRETNPGIQAGGLAGVAVAIGGLKRRGMQIELPLPGEERCWIYRFPGKYRQLDGLRTEWITARP